MVPSLFVATERQRMPCAARFARFALALICGAALTAQAQAPRRADRPDPLDPKARVPAVSYQSPFAQYRRLSDEKLLSWREANDTVAGVGGWRVYAREAQQPDPSPAAKPASAPPPAGHNGHQTP